MFLRAIVTEPDALGDKLSQLQDALVSTDGRWGEPHLEIRMYCDHSGRPLYPECEVVLIEGSVEIGSGYRIPVEITRQRGE